MMFNVRRIGSRKESDSFHQFYSTNKEGPGIQTPPLHLILYSTQRIQDYRGSSSYTQKSQIIQNYRDSSSHIQHRGYRITEVHLSILIDHRGYRIIEVNHPMLIGYRGYKITKVHLYILSTEDTGLHNRGSFSHIHRSQRIQDY